MEARDIKNNEIKLDIDGGHDALIESFNRIEHVLSFFNIQADNGAVYKTNKGYHIYIFIERPLPPKTLVFIQLMMGSDYKREMFNYARINAGLINWNVLFRRKWVDSALVSQEELLEQFTLDLNKMIEEINKERF